MATALALALAALGTAPGAALAGQPPGIDYAALVETYGRAVVHVSVRRNDPPASQTTESAAAESRPARGFGSGFVVSRDGYIITNEHVVADSSEVVVQFPDRRSLRAQVVGIDSQTDIALLKVDAADLPTVRIGDPDRVRVGEPVAAIGSPFGYDHSVTSGIVSAKSRDVDDLFVPFIQTDAAINPGNSGGPLFNAAGEVIGVNSRIIPRAGGFVGLSFAVPIDIAMRVADQLKSGRAVVRGRIGVTVQPITADLARAFGLERARGALVTDLEDGGPAQRAGLATGDVVVAVQGRELDSSLDLPRAISALSPGTVATMDVMREGLAVQVRVPVVATREPKRASGVLPAAGGPESRLGLALRPLNAEEKRRYAIERGVAVDAVTRRSAASDAELKAGDLLLAVRGKPVDGVAGFREALAARPGAPLALLIVRAGQRKFVALDTDALRADQGPLAGVDSAVQ